MNAPNLQSQEFEVFEHFQRFFRRWWVLTLAAILGGLFGYGFHLARPPVYEAVAHYYISVDSTLAPDLPDAQYMADQDMALASTWRILMDPATISQVIEAANANQIEITSNDLLKNARIERQLAVWELGYRSPDPVAAQKVVNLWAQAGYEVMQEWSRQELVPPYVMFTPPVLAEIPDSPAWFNLNRLILAGSLIGLILGLILIEAWLVFSPGASASRR